MVVRLLLAVGASLCFVAGSMFMQPAAGLTRLWPTLAVFASFAVGLVLDTMLVRRGGEVASAVLIVVGLESVLAVGLARWLFGEPITPFRLAAIGLVLGGVLLLTAGEPGQTSTERPSVQGQPLAQLAAAADAELGVDALQVGVHRPAGHVQPRGELVAPLPAGHCGGDLPLAG